MFGVTRARRCGQRVLRIRTKFIRIEMSIVGARLNTTRHIVVAPSHAPQQQIHLVVCFLTHCRRKTAKDRTQLSQYLARQKLSFLINASRSVSRCCATSTNERSVSAAVQPRSEIRIWLTRLRKSV